MPLRSLKIAIVDDDQIYQFIMHRTLTKLDPSLKVLNFSNCADILNFLKRNADNSQLLPDLLLIELNTPFMNGWEFLNAYKEIKGSLCKTIDIYIITSSVDPNDQIKAAAQEDLSGLYTKPITPDQLQQTIHKACSRTI